MNTFEVAQLFRRYCDEPDQSFLSDADVAIYLKLGYAEFINLVNEMNPNARVRGTLINLAAGATTYDLTQSTAVQFLGADLGGESDESSCGTFHLYDPSHVEKFYIPIL